MAKENPDTKTKKDTNSAFQKFDALARRIIRVPKEQIQKKKR